MTAEMVSGIVPIGLRCQWL